VAMAIAPIRRKARSDGRGSNTSDGSGWHACAPLGHAASLFRVAILRVVKLARLSLWSAAIAAGGGTAVLTLRGWGVKTQFAA
jgi:hypothetical protein